MPLTNREHAEITEQLRAMIPENLLSGIDRYVNDRVETGSFLRAVFENNLFKAMERGDLKSRSHLFDIVNYIYNECPAGCWGSPEKVEKWIKG